MSIRIDAYVDVNMHMAINLFKYLFWIHFFLQFLFIVVEIFIQKLFEIEMENEAINERTAFFLSSLGCGFVYVITIIHIHVLWTLACFRKNK